MFYENLYPSVNRNMIGQHLSPIGELEILTIDTGGYGYIKLTLVDMINQVNSGRYDLI
jgi:hypothetical protein